VSDEKDQRQHHAGHAKLPHANASLGMYEIGNGG
jgi:hypothetical protein